MSTKSTSTDRAREWFEKNGGFVRGAIGGRYVTVSQAVEYAASETARADAAEAALRVKQEECDLNYTLRSKHWDSLQASNNRNRELQAHMDKIREAALRDETRLCDALEASDKRNRYLTEERDRQYEYNVGQIAKQAELEAELAATQERVRVLQKHIGAIRRTPAMPFPDPGAHSVQAFSNAVYAAWCRIMQIADAALSPEPAKETK